MKNIIYIIIILLAAAAVYADDMQFNCADCHKNTVEVLKKGHAQADSFSKCFDCHDSESKAGSLGQKIHLKHTDSLGSSAETCLSCHAADKDGNVSVSHKNGITFSKEEMKDLADKFATWNDSPYLANSHKKSGVYCLDCHDTFGPDDVDEMAKKCKGCHGEYEDLAKKTADKKRNPHKSHFGNMSCVKCHNVHEDFTDFCDKCHKTNMKWNRKIK
ncbi:cytochrome c3 family protein [Seleniivibrio sp.]|uniref:cytochrome c3 family protein n=1 Tax=Seleniivibrio sp. TaxID=2898801 RepID=UPI0025D37045|nr:cytochrome c3 family protein [Seleniivibrio sp.]MCD8554156.1 cytochrome c3 family protein [Seleniivibrio sp.]